jgi:predicted HAD superfamily phosphohydrolase
MITEEEFSDLKKRVEKLEQKIQELTERPPKATFISSYEQKIEKFAESIGITIEKLKNVVEIDFDNQDIFILKPITGKNEEEKQLKSSLIILTIYKNIFGENEIFSQKLRESLKKLGIKSLINLSTNLSKYKQFIIPKGKRSSKKYKYMLTLPGETKGKELIKELSEK